MSLSVVGVSNGGFVTSGEVEQLKKADEALTKSRFQLERGLSDDPKWQEDKSTIHKVCLDVQWNSRTVTGTTISGARALQDILPVLAHKDVSSQEKADIVNRWHQGNEKDYAEIRPYFDSIGSFLNDIKQFANRIRTDGITVQASPVQCNRCSHPPPPIIVAAPVPTENPPNASSRWANIRAVVFKLSPGSLVPRPFRKPVRKLSNTLGSIWTTLASLVVGPPAESPSHTSQPQHEQNHESSPTASPARPSTSLWNTFRILRATRPVHSAECVFSDADELISAIDDFKGKIQILHNVYAEYNSYRNKIISTLEQSRTLTATQLDDIIRKALTEDTIPSLERYSRSAPLIQP